MGFECRICGSCCMYLGDYIVIEKQTGPYSFSCCCVSTDTSFSATIDPDKRHFFDDHTFPSQHPSACRFLRPLGDGRTGCTIHTDSPAQCKYYRCMVMRIFSAEGEELGTVTGTLALHSTDPALLGVWEDIRRAIPGSSPDDEKQIQEGLVLAGYEVR